MIIVALLAFAITVYLFILFIVKADRGSKEPIGALFGAMGFGILAVIAAGTLNEMFVPREVMEQLGSEDAGNVSNATLLKAALIVGVIEESVKAIPLAVFIYKKRYFNELTDGIIYFGIVGLTFGIIEDFSYSLMYGGEVGLLRILFSPYLHAGFCAIFGMYFVQKKLLKKPWTLVLIGYLIAVLAHAIFDFAAFTGGPISVLVLLVITIAVNVSLFVFFKKAKRLDEARGMSAVGTNRFCRNCGRPNQERYLYCLWCGKRT